VVITTPPYSNLTITALNYIEAALSANVAVVGVFFYQDGVLNASNKVSITSDEFQTVSRWQTLHQVHQLPLHLCNTAGEKRGLSDEGSDSESKIGNNTENNSDINSAFTVSGLGELVEITNQAQRVVQF